MSDRSKWDSGGQKALDAGHRAARTPPDSSWRDMDDAPRDGTTVEIMCTYGVAPSYALCRWTDGALVHDLGAAGALRPYMMEKADWVNIKTGGGFIDERHLKWRHYTGDPANYVDPTGGLSETAAYWRGAVAAKHGLAPDHFEEEVRARVKARESAPATVQVYRDRPECPTAVPMRSGNRPLLIAEENSPLRVALQRSLTNFNRLIAVDIVCLAASLGAVWSAFRLHDIPLIILTAVVSGFLAVLLGFTTWKRFKIMETLDGAV